MKVNVRAAPKGVARLSFLLAILGPCFPSGQHPERPAAGFKIPLWQHSVGSSPTSGSTRHGAS